MEIKLFIKNCMIIVGDKCAVGSAAAVIQSIDEGTQLSVKMP